ncbi:MAG: hypothetical protein MUE90_05090 [Thermoanaerobaculales bacterium]|jgi:Spy/CpxP family protein refolding chaperone|nr:hypothetical protein [Thermoanaerobaculales bacterium]
MGCRAVIGATVAGLLLAASSTGAQQAPPAKKAPPRMRAMMQRAEQASRWWNRDEVAAKVGVTAGQKSQLDEMADAAVNATKEAARRYAQAYARLMSALSESEPKPDALAAARLELEQANAAVLAASVDRLLAMRGVLSPQQWSTLREVQPAAFQIGQMRLRGSGSSAGPEGDGVNPAD